MRKNGKAPAGQFLFLPAHGLPAHGESHPFTIASNWNPENQQINLIIKDLGDYTHRLPQRLNISDTIQIDGAYGRFNFSDKNEQIWVSNSIGFTPFKRLTGSMPIEIYLQK